ncbi:MFS transporter [Paenibacillus sp. CAA11]|uniref:MFS transporter n=1 Tax=Paenibacillus sp. CAA11 TaxID=1532905 RepID=UPI000D3576B7|nr:MFS transporter [Paenibacillus sp. CAA11]AWB43736.1 MFS transporter [Paenibacillus sp. CAA11]
MSNHSAFTVIRRRKGYAGLFLAGIINGIGDRFSQVAMLSLLLNLTGSGMAVGLTMGLRIVPYLLLAPVGGMLASKLSRKAIMVAADLLRVPFALSFLLVRSAEDVWIVYAASMALAAGEALYAPVRKSAVPLLVKLEELLAVNGLEQALTGCVLVIGAVTGGAVSLWLGSSWAFILNALSFLTTAGVIYRINFTPLNKEEGTKGQADAKQMKTQDSNRASYTSLGALIAGSLVVQIALGFELLVPLFNGLENVLISVYAIQVFGAGDLGVGLMYGAIGTGLILSMFAGRFIDKGRKAVIWGAMGCLMLEGILMILMSAAPALWTACGIYLVLTFAGGVGNACLDTALMRELPEQRQGPMFGLLAALGGALMGLSMLGAGVLLEWFDPRTVGRLGGLGYAASALLLALYWFVGRGHARRKEREEKPLPSSPTR